MFDSNEKSNIYSPYQTLTPSKPISNSLRSLFSSHFLPQSYIKPLNFHPNLSTKLSQSTYQKSFESKSSLLKTPKLSTSTNEIERISNQYKKLLNLRLKEEKTERIFKEFKIFKGFEKRLIVNNLIINGDNDINTSDTGICDNNIHYFLYKLDEFFHEKIEELLKSQKINEKFIKEVFSFISDQIHFLIRRLSKFDKTFSFVLNNAMCFFLLLWEKSFTNIQPLQELENSHEKIIEKNNFEIKLKESNFQKEKIEWDKQQYQLKRETAQKYNDLLNENLDLQQKIQQYQAKFEEIKNESNVNQAFKTMETNIKTFDRLLINLNREQSEQSRIYSKGLNSLINLVKATQTRKRQCIIPITQQNLLPESMFYEFPEKLKTIIQHPFKPFLLKNLPNVVEEIILPLTETKIIELLNNFLDEWDETITNLENPPLRFIDFLLNLYNNTFTLSYSLTQIYIFLKETEKKLKISLFFSKLFFLTKTKHQIDKTSLFFFLLFRRAFIKENPQLKSFEQEELLLNYNETFDIIRETFRNYSVYDDFLVKFNSNVIIRSPYCFLEKIAQKFNFLNKNDAILHLETILQRSDLSNKNQLIYGSFKELMLKTYDIDVGNEESLDMKEGEEIIYPNLIKKLTDSMKIDFYEVQNTIIQAFCEVICEKNELNRKNMLETINLFDYRPFKEKNKEYGPLIFSGVFFENNFLKIHDYLKKKANQSCDKSLNILDNLEFTDFYNKNKIKEHFFEILAFNDMISYVNSHFIPPQPEKIKAIEEKTSFNSRNSSYSRNSRVSFKGKKSNHIENSPVNKTKKSNIFSGIKLILAKKPFKRKTKQLNIK